MPEIKKTATTKTASSTNGASTSASAERARKEALRAEVLSVYSKKQNYKTTTETGKETAEMSPPVEEEQKPQNVYNTPFFSGNAPKTPVQSEAEPEEILSTVELDSDTIDDKQVPQGKSFAEFSKENYDRQDVAPSSDFSSQNYDGFSPKRTTPTKIIKEKKYSRSPRAEKVARFFNYLFTTKEGWYYILGTLCLIFIIVLFFI